jgi:hypothetical protein
MPRIPVARAWLPTRASKSKPQFWRGDARVAGAFCLETAAKLLSLLEGILAIFSKHALKSLNNQPDFDSAILRFDPFRPSQLILLV